MLGEWVSEPGKTEKGTADLDPSLHLHLFLCFCPSVIVYNGDKADNSGDNFVKTAEVMLSKLGSEKHNMVKGILSHVHYGNGFRLVIFRIVAKGAKGFFSMCRLMKAGEGWVPEYRL